MLNQVVLVGRLTSDPEAVTLEGGHKKSIFNVAVPRSYKNQNGEYETDFIRCVLWNAIAAHTAEYCHKGDLVGVKGRLQNRSYEDEEGNKKYITEVIVDKISFLASKKDVDFNLED